MTSTDNKEIRDFVTVFVDELINKINQNTKESIHATLAGALGELPAARRSVPGSQRHYKRKKCPVPGCENLGAPGFKQFCKEVHGPEFKAKGPEEFDRMKAQYWGEAMKPGGAWYEEKRVPQKRGRKPKNHIAAAG